MAVYFDKRREVERINDGGNPNAAGYSRYSKCCSDNENLCPFETQDEQAKQTFQQIADNLENALEQLKGRQQYIQQQEPQYRQQ